MGCYVNIEVKHEPRHDTTNKMSVRTVKTKDQPGHPESALSAWRNLGSLAIHWVHSEDPDQTGWMPRLIWVFAGRTYFVGFVMSWLMFFHAIIFSGSPGRCWKSTPMTDPMNVNAQKKNIFDRIKIMKNCSFFLRNFWHYFVLVSHRRHFCLCWGLTSQSTIFQSCRDGATASWVINQYFWGVKCLAQGHNTAAVGFEPPTSRSRVRHSTTEPPRSPSPPSWSCEFHSCPHSRPRQYTRPPAPQLLQTWQRIVSRENKPRGRRQFTGYCLLQKWTW